MKFYKAYFLLFILLLGFQNSFSQAQYEVVKSDAEWKSQLDDLSYLVLRKAYTERPYTGKYDNFYEKGTYHCAGCDEALYKSDHKYNSYCGWPSFDREIKDKLIFHIRFHLAEEMVFNFTNNKKNLI